MKDSILPIIITIDEDNRNNAMIKKTLNSMINPMNIAAAINFFVSQTVLSACDNNLKNQINEQKKNNTLIITR